jgi:hypothetical protein
LPFGLVELNKELLVVGHLEVRAQICLLLARRLPPEAWARTPSAAGRGMGKGWRVKAHMDAIHAVIGLRQLAS